MLVYLAFEMTTMLCQFQLNILNLVHHHFLFCIPSIPFPLVSVALDLAYFYNP